MKYVMFYLVSCLLYFVTIGECDILPSISKLGNLFRLHRSEPTERKLLPKLPPHDDTCFMLEFITEGSDHCIQMEPVVKRLEQDLCIKVRKIDISKRSDFMKLYDCVGGNECGSVPFFYNRRTAQAICGATPYQNLKNLAMGNPIHFFHDAPQNVFDSTEYDPKRQRGVGLADYLSEKMFSQGTSTNTKEKKK